MVFRKNQNQCSREGSEVMIYSRDHSDYKPASAVLFRLAHSASSERGLHDPAGWTQVGFGDQASLLLGIQTGKQLLDTNKTRKHTYRTAKRSMISYFMFTSFNLMWFLADTFTAANEHQTSEGNRLQVTGAGLWTSRVPVGDQSVNQRRESFC